MPATSTFAPPPFAAPLRVSDVDRERTVAILRDHWLAGRLTLAELEARSSEAYGARHVNELWAAVRELPVPVPPATARPRTGRSAEAAWSVLLSATGTGILVLSLGFLFLLALPLTVTGWALGRSVRRDPAVVRGRSAALAGEVMGAAGTVFACLALAACSAIIAAA